MNVGIVGTGYVGLISALCFADVGHQVISCDKRVDVIHSLQQGKATIFEPGLTDLFSRVMKKGSIRFTPQMSNLKDCNVVLLAVGTPALPNGQGNVSQVFKAAKQLIEHIPPQTPIILRSTVPVGTTSILRAQLSELGRSRQILGFCPEFLREGSAIDDFMNPSFLVYASDSEKSLHQLKMLYQPIRALQKKPAVEICTSSYETAELIKGALNSFLAMKVTFINQIAQLAYKTHSDINAVIRVLSNDERIGALFLNPSPGFGGSCFPKDTKALVHCARDFQVNLSLVHETTKANEEHKLYIASWIHTTLQRLELRKTWNIGVWGLTFKANTDDVRESAALSIVKTLHSQGHTLHIHDPTGTQKFQSMLGNIQLHSYNEPQELLSHVDALVILTDWQQYRDLTSSGLQQRFKDKIIFDTRAVCSLRKFNDAGIAFHQFGKSRDYVTEAT